MIKIDKNPIVRICRGVILEVSCDILAQALQWMIFKEKLKS